ncbi:MAG: adenosylcobinamide-GDP ribazoletransferase [Firmicutes bacterium]|nr:adenosylcobinamide-GDP ribazoletransferase [Bacillota bacterium]
MKHFLLAWRFLTILPLGRDDGKATAGDMVSSTYFYPLVGALLGLVLAGTFALTNSLLPAFSAALTVTVWAVWTAGMHLDGLMDTFDGLGVRGDLPRRLAVMRDSSVGAFGVLAAVLLLLLKTAALVDLALSPLVLPAILLAPVAGRAAMVALMATGRYARTGAGLGQHLVEGTGSRQLMVGMLFSLLLAVLVLDAGTVFILLAVQVALFVLLRNFFRRGFGGLTGDLLGAACELHELVWLSTALFII